MFSKEVETMSNLQTRLKELRNEKNLTQSEMAKILREKYSLKTDRVMISKWETGFQIPEIFTISCIADLFGVSIDYLNGKEETPAIKPVERKLTNNEKIFLEEINDLTEEEQQKVLDFIHFTKSQRTKRINLSPGTELAAFGGDFVSKPKKKKPEIL